MAYSSKSDTWIAPCDLCGSLRHETFGLPGNRTARSCRDCGLVTIPQPEQSARQRPAPLYELPLDPALAAIRNLDRDCSVLVIGAPSAQMIQVAAQSGISMTALLEPGSAPIPAIRTQEWSLDAASFPPDNFDLILCQNGLESFTCPSLLFKRVRYWLRPGGIFMVGALNLRSLPARIRRRSWLHQCTPGAEHLFSLDTIKGYAQRYGFGIRSVRTRSRTEDIASILAGNEHPSWMMSVIAAPLVMAGAILGIGMMIMVEMTKEGLALRPLRRELEEEVEGSPGLAPALYTSVQREAMAEYG